MNKRTQKILREKLMENDRNSSLNEEMSDVELGDKIHVNDLPPPNEEKLTDHIHDRLQKEIGLEIDHDAFESIVGFMEVDRSSERFENTEFNHDLLKEIAKTIGMEPEKNITDSLLAIFSKALANAAELLSV